MTPQALTHAELDELAALEAKATPGEWLQEPWYCEEGGWCAMGPHRECDPDSDDELEETDEPGSPCHKRAQADAAYVRALTAAAPALLAMARRLGEVTCQKCKRAFPHNEEMVCMCCNASLVDDACFYENRYVHVGDLTQQLTAATARAEALQARAQAAEKRCGELEKAASRIERGEHRPKPGQPKEGGK